MAAILTKQYINHSTLKIYGQLFDLKSLLNAIKFRQMRKLTF